MNSHLPAPESALAPRRNWTRRLVNLLVTLVVVAVAAATFVFSYPGVHAIALLGGVSTQLARYYPGLFDAVLVIACVAAVVLRDGRWWARLWAWLVLVVLLGAIAVADVLHAMNYTLRPRPTEGIVAAAPVAAVLLAFSLLLTMLRQSRSHHESGPGDRQTRRGGLESVPGTLDIPGLSLPLAAAEASTMEIPALAASQQLRPPAPPIALPAAFTPPPPVAEAAIPMPAPEADIPQDTVPDSAPDTAPDTAPAREDLGVAQSREAEPPTVLTPAVSEPPAVPAAASTPERAHQEEQMDAAPETAETAPAETAPAEAASLFEAPEPPTVPVPARKPAGIRYAGGAVPRTAQPATGEPAREAAPADYWDAEDAGPYAGLVYPARDGHADGEGNGNGHNGNGQNGDMDGDGDSASDQPPGRRQPQELDDDAPPFATAPFAPVPRLNRVRSMPAPPADDEK